MRLRKKRNAKLKDLKINSIITINVNKNKVRQIGKAQPVSLKTLFGEGKEIKTQDARVIAINKVDSMVKVRTPAGIEKWIEIGDFIITLWPFIKSILYAIREIINGGRNAKD